jgi:hypothetical protein
MFMPQQHDWLGVVSASIETADGTCRIYSYACGVIVSHLRQQRRFSNLASLATWRYASYNEDLPWAAGQLAALLGPVTSLPRKPEYVLSMYGWAGEDLDSALRLMCLPAVLVNRRAADRPRPVDAEVERRLLADRFDHPDITPFGIQGVSIGYAGWSGLSYYPLAPDRALPLDDLIACELDIQMLWTYCRQIQREVEDGRDPRMRPEYGWRFLRAAHSRLTTARTQETAQHCVMRQTALVTSGLPDRLLQAQDALREGVALSGRVPL